MKKFIFIMTVFMLGAFLSSLVIADQKKKSLPLDKVRAKPRKFVVDVGIVYINATKCMCEEDMKKYVKTMAPYTVEVGLENKSNSRVKVKLEVSWISRYRKMGQKFEIVPRTITLEPKRSHLETIWANNFYDLIKIPDGITAKVTVDSKRFMDTKPGNNTKNIDSCFYYMY